MIGLAFPFPLHPPADLISPLWVAQIDDSAHLGHFLEHLDVLIGGALPIVAKAQVLIGQLKTAVCTGHRDVVGDELVEQGNLVQNGWPQNTPPFGSQF